MVKITTNIKKLIVLPLLICLLSSCSSSDSSIIQYDEIVNISFSWWGNDDRNEYTIKAIKNFEKLHENISVKCNYSEWTGYQTKMDIQMRSQTQSDVMQINYAWINQYSPNGDTYYNINLLSDIVDLSNFTQKELNFGMQNGKLNAIPIALNSQILYYNKDIYDNYGLDIPTTWDDLFHSASIMKKDGVYPLCIPASKPLMLLAISYTEQVTNHTFLLDDNTIGFNQEDMAIMLKFAKSLLDEKVIPPLNEYEKSKIGSGQYAGVMAWITDANNFCPDDKNFIVGEFLTPTDEQNSKLGWYSKPSTMYAISAYTEYPIESGMLLDFLLNSDEMAEAQQLEKGVPLSKSAQDYLQDRELLNGIQFDAFKIFENHSLEMNTMSPYIENQTLINAFQDVLDLIYYKDESIEIQSNNALEQFESILKEL